MALSGGKFPFHGGDVPPLQRCPLRESASPCSIPLTVGLAARFLRVPTSVHRLAQYQYCLEFSGRRGWALQCRSRRMFPWDAGGTMRSLRLLYVVARSELACAGVAFPRDAGGTIRSLRLLRVP